MPESFQLIIGLGNPGPKYAFTRHNVGFLILDRIAAGGDLEWRNHARWNASVARGFEATWVKPQTFMNLSGDAAEAVRGFYQIPVERTLVIYDDLDLPLGQLRLKPGGGAGGHNGIKDLIRAFGTDKIPRLRFGIGRQAEEAGEDRDRQGTVSHVLGRFSESEEPTLEKSLAEAEEAIHCARLHGLDEAMNRFNNRQG